MSSLDHRGIAAAVQVGLYVPVAAVAGDLLIRFALRRDAGWLFLLIFALTRVTDGALIIAGETVKTKMDLFTPAYTMQAAGLAPLMLASLGFLGLAGHRAFSEYPRFSRMLRLLSLLDIVAFTLAIAGGLCGSPVAPTRGAAGLVLRRVAACCFVVLFLGIVLAHFAAYSHRWLIKPSRQRLLEGLFLALPFLGARSAYAVLAAWSSSDLYGRKLSRNTTLAALNPVTGIYQYFIVLSVLCELFVSLIYLASSAVAIKRRH